MRLSTTVRHAWVRIALATESQDTQGCASREGRNCRVEFSLWILPGESCWCRDSPHLSCPQVHCQMKVLRWMLSCLCVGGRVKACCNIYGPYTLYQCATAPFLDETVHPESKVWDLHPGNS